MGIVRTEEDLSQALERIQQFREELETVSCDGNRNFNPGWHASMALNHMLTVAEAIARAARERKESRGGHFRDDYPAKDEEFSKVNISVKKDSDGNMGVQQVPRTPIREDLQKVIEELK